MEHRAKAIPLHQVPPELVPEEGLVGPVFLFRSTERGTFFRAWTSDGEEHSRYTGRVLWAQLFDSVGDGAPGGVSLEFRAVKEFGNLPWDLDICELAQELVG